MNRQLPPTDRPRPTPPRRLMSRVLGLVTVSALVLAAFAALVFWVLLSDPVAAAAVIDRGDVLPAFQAIAVMIGKAFATVFRMM